MKFKPEIKQIAQEIAEKGGRMFLVGGAVRDIFMQREPNDLDFMVQGIWEKDAKEIIGQFGSISDADVISNAPVFIARIDDQDFEFAMARKEISVAPGKSGFKFFSCPDITLKDDMVRRDFTIGAIAKDVLSGNVFDFFGGISDIHNKVIRCVDPNTFVQSPERAFRAFSQAARFGFDIEPLTSELIFAMKDDFVTIPREQIWRHVEKFAKDSVNPSWFVSEMVMSDWIDFFPEVHISEAIMSMRDLKQGKFDVCDVVAAMMADMSWEEENSFRERICIPKQVFKKAVEIKDNGAPLPEKWVNGGEVIQKFGIKPGPEVSFWTGWAFVGQINGIFQSKDEAVQWIGESIKDKKK